ncbi:serine/threonine-protein kinase [Actinoplanes sp. NPDC049118]|uniref:serine/threonine-protein kinase n=1 Tax=Actinoplanes sp. NPDC049118 TaxID=3155769 RepID=UPI0033C8B545
MRDPLGGGGFGQVWQADDLLHGILVAVKFLLPEIAATAPLWVKSFKQEARIGALIEHTGITKVHDVGEYAGQWYLAMEFLEGQDLGTILKCHPQGLTLERFKVIATQIAQALEATHRHGVIHRDLKPNNVMVLPGDHVKICDFGIAHLTIGLSSTTLKEFAVGTPAYMSPEQWHGDTADHRSDLYSLGCIFYYMLTGQPPFTEQALPKLMMKHLNTMPAPLGSLRPDIGADLERLISGMLAKSPIDRPASAAVVTHRLHLVALQKVPVEDANRTYARNLVRDATRLARSLRRGTERDMALEAVTPAMVLVGVPGSRLLAADIDGVGRRIKALAGVAAALVKVDLDAAVKLAQYISSELGLPSEILEFSGILARHDPDRAEELARSQYSKIGKMEALVRIADGVARFDPGRAMAYLDEAEVLARSLLQDPAHLGEALVDIATVLPPIAQGHALRLLAEAEQLVVTETWSYLAPDARALCRIGSALVPFDREQGLALLRTAEHVARIGIYPSAIDGHWTLRAIARAFASVDPEHAEWISCNFLDDNEDFRTMLDIAPLLAMAEPTRAIRLLSKAEVAIRAIDFGKHWKYELLAEHASALALVQPMRSEECVRRIEPDFARAIALAGIAKAYLSNPTD